MDVAKLSRQRPPGQRPHPDDYQRPNEGRPVPLPRFAKEHPAVLTGILQRRDFLIMEATGLTTDSKGEKVGYFLMHSVTLRAAPELSEMDIIRGKLSFCFILRQRGPGKVELYCRGFSDPRGEMME